MPVSLWASVEVSDGSWRKHFAIDNDLETWWSADNFAPQWLEITFPPFSRGRIDRIELTTSQVAPGPATHKVRLENADGKLVAWHRFDRELSKDGDTFVLTFESACVCQLGARADDPGTKDGSHIASCASSVLWTSKSRPWKSSSQGPYHLTHAGDASGRLFVIEQEGRIRIVKDGILLDEPFLDISSRTRLGEADQWGLLGLAFPPDYPRTGRFYVSYVSVSGQNTVSRFRVSPDDPDSADPDSEEAIITFDQMTSRHPVGTLAFGPHDGFLFVAVGDSYGIKGEDSHVAQQTASFYGSILRLDVSSETGYTIPPDNPFVGTSGHAPEIWGLRPAQSLGDRVRPQNWGPVHPRCR